MWIHQIAVCAGILSTACAGGGDQGSLDQSGGGKADGAARTAWVAAVMGCIESSACGSEFAEWLKVDESEFPGEFACSYHDTSIAWNNAIEIWSARVNGGDVFALWRTDGRAQAELYDDVGVFIASGAAEGVAQAWPWQGTGWRWDQGGRARAWIEAARGAVAASAGRFAGWTRMRNDALPGLAECQASANESAGWEATQSWRRDISGRAAYAMQRTDESETGEVQLFNDEGMLVALGAPGDGGGWDWVE